LAATLSLVLAIIGCANNPFQPTATATATQGPSVAQAQMEQYLGPKAALAVGDFQVKASGATNDIGDGLREMLMTALFNSNRFIVLDRQALQDILLEQDLAASGRVKAGTGPAIGKLEAAEMYLYGVVSEFQMGASGTRLNFGVPNVPFIFGGGQQNAHLAIDLRGVDTTTGRILFSTRVEGKASDFDAGVATRLGSGRNAIPVSLGAYKNTPMEMAIRVTIDKAIELLATRTPQHYFHHSH
jgi:curli biogenesis system outer membrane secretion channel CsgG